MPVEAPPALVMPVVMTAQAEADGLQAVWALLPGQLPAIAKIQEQAVAAVPAAAHYAGVHH